MMQLCKSYNMDKIKIKSKKVKRLTVELPQIIIAYTSWANNQILCAHWTKISQITYHTKPIFRERKRSEILLIFTHLKVKPCN